MHNQIKFFFYYLNCFSYIISANLTASRNIAIIMDIRLFDCLKSWYELLIGVYYTDKQSNSFRRFLLSKVCSVVSPWAPGASFPILSLLISQPSSYLFLYLSPNSIIGKHTDLTFAVSNLLGNICYIFRKSFYSGQMDEALFKVQTVLWGYDCTSVVISVLILQHASGSLRATWKWTSEMASVSVVFLSKQTKSSFYCKNSCCLELFVGLSDWWLFISSVSCISLIFRGRALALFSYLREVYKRYRLWCFAREMLLNLR